MWVVGWGFLNGKKKKWGTTGDPDRRLGGHCPDMMKGRKKLCVYTLCHGGEQLILTQQGRAGTPEGLASGGCAIAASAENGDREAQHTSFGGGRGVSGRCRGNKVLSDLLCVKRMLVSQQFTSGFVQSTLNNLHSHRWSR